MSVTDRMPTGRSRPPSATVTTTRWILRSRMSATALSTGMSSGTLITGDDWRWRALRPRQWRRYGWTKVALTRSVREISPTA